MHFRSFTTHCFTRCARMSDGGGGALSKCGDCASTYSCPEHWIYHKDAAAGGGGSHCRPFRRETSTQIFSKFQQHNGRARTCGRTESFKGKNVGRDIGLKFRRPSSRVSRRGASGRHLVATRDLRAAELIMRDAPTVVGPSRQQEHVVCVECFG